MIAFGRVVVDDVEDHFEAGGVQRANHALEFAHGARRCPRCGEPALRREIAEAVVAPVIRQAALLEMPVARVMMHRHQLHGGDPQFLQMLDRRLRRQRLVRAAQVFGNVRVRFRESADVQLVDDRVVPRRLGRTVVAPRERRIDNGGERRECGVVALVERQILLGVTDLIAEHFIGPANRTRHRFRVWIHDNLVGVESVAAARLIWPANAITVELVRPRVRQERVPDHVGVLGERDARAFRLRIGRFEKAELDVSRVSGKKREVDADAGPGSAEWIGVARPGAHALCASRFVPDEVPFFCVFRACPG